MATSNAQSAWPAVWSDLYDVMDVDRQPHLAFYTGLVTDQTRSLVDLGCGTGSITVAMAARMLAGAEVTGVDLSPRMIEIAAARAPGHRWLVGDLCAPPVRGGHDLITICFHTLQALLTEAELDRSFAAIAALLAPGGRLAFDIYQPNEAWLARVSPEPALARSFVGADGRRIDVVESNSAYDTVTRILSGEWRLHDHDSGAILPVEPIVQRVRQYLASDIEAALARAGLEAIERFGELDRRPLTPGSKRQVYVCRRRPGPI